MAASVKHSAWLEWIAGLLGVASRQRHTATLPMQRFHCLLDELPLHLIPSQILDPKQAKDILSERLFLNPRCSVLLAGCVPTELQSHRNLLSGFALDCPIAWVRDEVTDALSPFWLGTKSATAVSELCAGDPAPESIPPPIRLLLAHAGILTPANYREDLQAQRSEVVHAAVKLFREKNYAPLANLIHPFNLAALRRYYRHKIRRGEIQLGDEQCPRRYVAHNEPVACYFHHQMANVVSAVAGEEVKPSYVYFASYLSGAELKKHTDRKQCEYSVTLCLDFSPEPLGATFWPICLDTSEGMVSVYQALGDGLIYRGTKVPHYRSALADGYTSTSIFFHYVTADFSGTLD
jgi:hypothetical protein